MNGRFITCAAAQGTPEWHLDRLGKVTGSNAACVTAKDRSGKGWGVTRADYMTDLVIERLTGKPTLGAVKNDAMAWGTEQEPYSRMAYEMARDLIIEETGFVYLPDLAAGTSVDGLISDRGRFGFWESKSPKSKTHLGYLEGKVLPTEHKAQVIHGFYVTGAEFCDFQSFDPRLPERLQTFIVRVEREEVAAEIATYEAALLQFLLELDAKENQLRLLAA